MCVTWLTLVCDMTHLFVWHDSLIRVTYLWHDSLIRVTWLAHACDMTNSFVWHDSLICVTWLTQTCDMTHSCVWHDSLIRVTCVWHDSLGGLKKISIGGCLIHMCDPTDSYVCRDSLICALHDASVCMTLRIHTWWHDAFIRVTCLTHMCDITPSNIRGQILVMCQVRHCGYTRAARIP